MTTPLNIYATRAFEEHPLGIWPLDDRADYVSFVSEQNQNLQNWTATGVDQVVSATEFASFPEVALGVPFPDVFINGVVGDASNNGLVTFTSPFTIQPSDLDLKRETLSIGLYSYTFEKTLNVRIGFRYEDSDTEEIYEVIRSAVIATSLSWAMMTETFKIPQNFKNLQAIIEIFYSDDQAPNDFVLNGVSVGQWAEEFQLESLGVNLIDIPESINIKRSRGLPAQPYGLPTQSGYYLAKDNFLLGRNFGLPLVFGSKNSTYIEEKDNSPSIIFPAFGFLNASGQFSKLTAEFWLRVQPQSLKARKIFGPISSLDGLYVEGPFFKLKIGNRVSSYYVGEWARPMLLHIRINKNQASVLLNGDQVIEMNLDPKEYRFIPSKQFQKDQDWVGFYSYEDFAFMQIDCFSVYPYEVSAILAKRRWIYGQAVEVPTNIRGANSPVSVFVDYPFAKYPKNYSFPSSSNWSSGNLENIRIERNSISPAIPPLPEVTFSDKSRDIWLRDLKESESFAKGAISLRPGEDWQETEGHLFFSDLNFLQNQTKAIYSVLENKDFSIEPQTIFEIKNSQAGAGQSLRVYSKGELLQKENCEVAVKFVEDLSGIQDKVLISVKNISHYFKNGTTFKIFNSDPVPSGVYRVLKLLPDGGFDAESVDIEEVIDYEDAENLNLSSTTLNILEESCIYYSFFQQVPLSQSVGAVQKETKETIFYKSFGQKLFQKYFVGMDFDKIVESYGRLLAPFFGSRQSLSLYVGGSENLQETFYGDIYKIGLCTDRNLLKIKNLFSSKGFALDYDNVFEDFGPNVFDAGSEYFGNDLTLQGNAMSPPPNFWSSVLDGGSPYDFKVQKIEDHIASYTLFVKQGIPSTKLGPLQISDDAEIISVSAPTGSRSYRISDFPHNFKVGDFLNMSSNEQTLNSGVFSWQVVEIFSDREFRVQAEALPSSIYSSKTPVPELEIVPIIEDSLLSLDVATESSWEDYVPLSYFAKSVPDKLGNLNRRLTFLQINIDYPFTNRIVDDLIDTSDSLVKAYVSFQNLQSGANAVSSAFLQTEPLDKDNVVRPGSNWLNTRYEVVNGTIIYPPREVNINRLAINVYLEFSVKGVIDNPVLVRKVELSSQSYGSEPAKIGTKFGADLIPYSKSKNYFNYSAAPAVSIYKGSTPYLYQTSDSGIEIKTNYSNLSNRGVSLPINKLVSRFFKIGSIQMSLKYGQNLFPAVPAKIFELEHSDGVIEFYLIADSPSRQRGQIYALNKQTKRLQSNIMFFNNGVASKRPVLYSNIWNVVGISFPGFLDFSEVQGALRITSPIMFNNVSFFQTSVADEAERSGTRRWSSVRSQLGELYEWGFWAGKEIIGGEIVDVLDEGSSWQEVVSLSAIFRKELDASNIYNIFTGTERIIAESGNRLPITNYRYSVLQDLRWLTQVIETA
jgi:hypothetical protein